MKHRPIVGVMGSGRHSHTSRTEPLGMWLASIGVNLLTGGGPGVMGAVSRAFVSVIPRAGVSIGILPARGEDSTPPPGYPNEWVEIPIRTHLSKTGRFGIDPMSRNHLNILSSDVIVALPGSEGTASEVELAIRYGRPTIAFVDNRSDIPGVDPEIPIGVTLAEVQAFVDANLPQWP